MMLMQLPFNIRLVREAFLLNLDNGDVGQADRFILPGVAEIHINRDTLLAMMADQRDAGIFYPQFWL